MISFLFGSTDDIKTIINSRLTSKETLPCWHSFSKDSKQARIQDITTALWGDNKPWFDFFGLIAKERELKIKSTLKFDLNERKIALVKDLQNQTHQEVQIKLSGPAYHIFKASEKQLLSRSHIDAVPLPATPATWRAWKKELASNPFRENTISPDPFNELFRLHKCSALEPIVQAFERGDLSNLKSHTTGLIVQAALLYRLYPGQIHMLYPSLEEALRRIEETQAFDRLLLGMVQQKLDALISSPDFEKRFLAKSSTKTESVIVDGQVIPFLKDLNDNTSDPFHVIFHYPDGTESIPLNPTDDKEEFCRTLLHLSKKRGPSFNFQLQQQLPFSPLLSAPTQALESALGNPIYSICKSGNQKREVHITIPKQEDAPVQIQYIYQGPLIAADLTNSDPGRGEFTFSYSYSLLQRDNGDWTARGPAIEPLRYENSKQ